MARYRIEHVFSVTYSAPVLLGRHRLHLHPRPGRLHVLEAFDLQVDPPAPVAWFRDPWDNDVAEVEWNVSTTALSVRATSQVWHRDLRPLDFLVAPHAVNFPGMLTVGERSDLAAFMQPHFPSEVGQLADWMRMFWEPGKVVETYVLLDHLNRTLRTHFTSIRRDEPGVWSPAETLRQRSGACRDLSALFVEACRIWGLPARFVSGYHATWEASQGQGDPHAWAEVYLPGAGWKGFDPTTGEIAGPRHIPLAISRDPASVDPVSGSYTGFLSNPPQVYASVTVTDLGE